MLAKVRAKLPHGTDRKSSCYKKNNQQLDFDGPSPAEMSDAGDTKEKQQGKRNDLTSANLAEVDRSGTSNKNVLRRLARDFPKHWRRVSMRRFNAGKCYRLAKGGSCPTWTTRSQTPRLTAGESYVRRRRSRSMRTVATENQLYIVKLIRLPLVAIPLNTFSAG
jgi:hypothetical protein